MKRTTHLGLAVLSVVAGAAACSSSSTPQISAAPPNDSGTGGDATSPTGPSEGDANALDAGPDATTPIEDTSPESGASSDSGAGDAGDAGNATGTSGARNSGDIILTSTVFPGASPFPVNSLDAAFRAGVTTTLSYAVVYNANGSLGPCQVETSSYSPPSGSGTSVGAGTISVTGGSSTFDLPPITVTHDAGPMVGYSPIDFANMGGSVAPGATLTFAASGATVPAFSTNVVVPGAIVVTTPSIADASTFSISSASDLPVAWTGTGPGSVIFSINQTSGASPTSFTSTSVVCTFAESSGGGTVPAAALGYLTPTSQYVPGPYGGPTALTVQLFSASAPSVSDWSIAVDVDIYLAFALGTAITIE